MNWKKNILGRVAVILAVGIVSGVAFWWMDGRHPTMANLFSGSPTLFCAGDDPKTGEKYKVWFDEKDANHAVVAIEKWAGNSSQGTVLYSDKNAFIGVGPESTSAKRISIKLGKEKVVQAFRDCTPPPICRIENISYMPDEKLEFEQKKVNDLEYEAYQFRKNTAHIADQFANLRRQLQENEGRLNDLKSKVLSKENSNENQAELKALSEKQKELSSQAETLIGGLHSATVATQAIHRNLKEAHFKLNQLRSDVEVVDLQSAANEQWCQ